MEAYASSSPSPPSPSPSPPIHAAVVGAGPVGCLTALSLAARGFSVSIYERRPDPRKHQVGSGSNERARSINLAISSRGLKALSSVQSSEETMADVVLRHAIPMKARMIHTKAADSSQVQLMSQAYGLHGECINSVSRHLLNDLLLNEAARHPSISLFFDCKLRSVDLDATRTDPKAAQDECRLDFEIWQGGGAATRWAAFILGSDGINSIIRSAIARCVPLSFSQEYIDSAYLELRIPPKHNDDAGDQPVSAQEQPSSAQAAADFALDPNHLHIWPRHSFMLIALANLDKSFTSTLFAPQDILSKLTTRAAILDFFKDEFPDALDVLGQDNVVETLLPRKGKGSSLSSIKCYPYHYAGRAAILGDAAHAMLPFYGQGLNCGFEDVAFLMDIFDEHRVRGDDFSARRRRGSTTSDSGLAGVNTPVTSTGDDSVSPPHLDLSHKLATVFESYSRKRHPHLLAINHLATANYHEMSSRVVSPLFQLRKSLDALLMKTLPKGSWMSLYSMVTFSPEIGYADAKSREEKQGKIIERVLWGSAAGAVVGFGLAAKWWMSVARYGGGSR